MAIKKRFVECECGEVFYEGSGNQLEGNVVFGPWRLRGNRQRATKTVNNCDILVALFFRSLMCGKCKQEILREQKQYELTPPMSATDDPVTTLSNREYVMVKAPSDSTIDLQAAARDQMQDENEDDDIVEESLDLAPKRN